MKNKQMSSPEATPFVRKQIVEIELSQQPLPLLSSTLHTDSEEPYGFALCLVRLHAQPIGSLEIELTPENSLPGQYLPLIWKAMGAEINVHLTLDELPPVQELTLTNLAETTTPRCILAREQYYDVAPFVSIIVATHERTKLLDTSLRSLLALHYPHYEIIIVDNAPVTDATEKLIKEDYSSHMQAASTPILRYIREGRKGLAWARNCGARLATGSIIAFVDDDVIVDRYWLLEIVRAFICYPRVACVSGLVMPARLDTPAQTWFEEYGGFGKGFTPHVYDLQTNRSQSPLFPYNAGSFGTGASMAFTAAFFRMIDGCDPVLSGGGPANAGEDLELFFRVIQQGYQLVYEPRALVYHLHRADYAGLRTQIYRYGIGLTAFLTKVVLDNPHLLVNFLKRVPKGITFMFNNRSSKNRNKSITYPTELTQLELLGMLYGPLALLQSHYRARRLSYAKSD